MSGKQIFDLEDLPQQIRVSIGSAIVLGLLHGKLDAIPTTAYFMTYKAGKCTANCGFCPQARGSTGSTEMLSRISWPAFPMHDVLTSLRTAVSKGVIKRICIQALNYPKVFPHLETIVKTIKNQVDIPLSVSCQPLNKENIFLLKDAGVDRLGIALDAANDIIFDEIKGRIVGGSYSWEGQFLMLREALRVFGVGNVSTHLIIGLGETEKEAIEAIQKYVDMGVLPALFAFTPIRGTALENKVPPSIQSYRRMQLARYLVVKGLVTLEKVSFTREGNIMRFEVNRELLESAINSGEPFRTSGCQDCNRPFYNEKPSGPIYNFPFPPNREEIGEIKRQLGAV